MIKDLQYMIRIFDECVIQARKIGRKYMLNTSLKDEEVSKEEWQLAIVLFEWRMKE